MLTMASYFEELLDILLSSGRVDVHRNSDEALRCWRTTN